MAVVLHITLMALLLVDIPTGVDLQTPTEEGTLYFADSRRSGIYSMPLSGGNHVRIAVTNAQNPIAVGVDSRAENLYWSERGGSLLTTRKFIARHSFNTGSGNHIELPRKSIPDGIAFAPISRLVFYTDAGNGNINVATADLTRQRLIIAQGLGNPRGIAVHPEETEIYWTDWHADFAHIGKAELDGSNRKRIVTHTIGWPNGVAVDYDGSVLRIYWVDARSRTVESCNSDGTSRRILKNINAHLYDLIVHNGFIYITAWDKHAIMRMPKSGTGNVETVGQTYAGNSTRFNGIALKLPSATTGETNACSGFSAGCAHICIPKGQSAVCLCDHGYYLDADKKTCLKAQYQRGLLITDEVKAGLFKMDLDVDEVERIPLFNFDQPRDVAYDINIDRLYWIDSKRKLVAYTCSRSTSLRCTQVIFEPQLQSNPSGIAIDPGRQQVYIVDEGLDTITRYGYSGDEKTVLINTALDNPRSIALHLKSSAMYWTDWGSNAKIERASMVDGSVRAVIVATKLGWPNGLTIDSEKGKLYWTDGRFGLIEASNLDGTGREVIHRVTGLNLQGITFGENKLFWTVLNESYIYSMDLSTRTTTTFGRGHFDNPSGLDFFTTVSPSPGPTPMTNPGQTPGPTPMPPEAPVSPALTSSSPGQTPSLPGLIPRATDGLPTVPFPPERIDQTIIIAVSVGIGGLVIIIIIIVVGVIFYRKASARARETHQPSGPGLTNPAFKPDVETEYSEVLDLGRPPIRPPAPPPPELSGVPPPAPPGERPHPLLDRPDVWRQQFERNRNEANTRELPPTPSPAPLLAAPPPIPRGVPVLPVTAAPETRPPTTGGYVDRGSPLTDYSGLMADNREPERPPSEYTPMSQYVNQS